jgi:hypothetical protein
MNNVDGFNVKGVYGDEGVNIEGVEYDDETGLGRRSEGQVEWEEEEDGAVMKEEDEEDE